VNYRLLMLVEWWGNRIVDNIPAATKYFTEGGEGDQAFTVHYEKGFALGFVGGTLDV
jgi:hypothetical protein